MACHLHLQIKAKVAVIFDACSAKQQQARGERDHID